VEAVVAAPCPVVGGLGRGEGCGDRGGRRTSRSRGRGGCSRHAAAGCGERGALAAGLLPGALALPVGGLLAGVGAEAALAARVVGLGEAVAAGWAVAVDDVHVHRRSPLLRSGVVQQLVGAAAAAAAHGHDLGRGDGRAAGPLAIYRKLGLIR
jgi:hypothetical protein